MRLGEPERRSAGQGGLSAGAPAAAAPRPGVRRPGGWFDWLAALLLFAAALGAYLGSTFVTSYDSYYSLQVTASFYEGDWGELSDYRSLIEERRATGASTYQVVETQGRIFSFYPIGTPLLAVPLMAAMDWLEPGFVKGLRRATQPEVEQRFAALLCALAPPLFFLALRRRGFGLAVALAGALSLAFSTTLWSQASRGLWQHGPLLICFCGLLWALAPERPGWRRWLRAGLCGGLAYLVRPSALVAIAPFGIVALRQGLGPAAAYAAGCALGIGAAAAYNLWAFGGIVPIYASMAAPTLAEVPGAAAALLVSPSRGLLVFTPVLLLAGCGLVQAWRRRRLRGLDWAILAAGLAQFTLICAWQHWEGGNSYGPRLQTDLLPFGLWFLCFALQAGGALSAGRRALLWGGFLVLFAAGAAIHWRGANDIAVYYWNHEPAPLSRARIWDWSDPQFLRGW